MRFFLARFLNGVPSVLLHCYVPAAWKENVVPEVSRVNNNSKVGFDRGEYWLVNFFGETVASQTTFVIR
jgi:hypothetical protein